MPKIQGAAQRQVPNGAPEILHAPVWPGEPFCKEAPVLRCLSFQEWKRVYPLVLPPLLTTDFEVLKEAFSRAFFANPASRDLIAQQDMWRVDIVQDMASPTAGVFNPIITSMQRVNARRIEALEGVRVLAFFEKPCLEHASGWVEIGASQETLPKLIPVQEILEPVPALQDEPYFKGLFGPNRTSTQEILEALFCTRQTSTPGAYPSWMSLTTLPPHQKNNTLWLPLDPHQSSLFEQR